MITKENAVKISTKKWELYSKGIRPKNEDCGFCLFCESFTKEEPSDNNHCKKYCPLYPDICDNCFSTRALYWKHYGINDTENAKKMLREIKKRGEAWINNVSLEEIRKIS